MSGHAQGPPRSLGKGGATEFGDQFQRVGRRTEVTCGGSQVFNWDLGVKGFLGGAEIKREVEERGRRRRFCKLDGLSYFFKSCPPP